MKITSAPTQLKTTITKHRITMSRRRSSPLPSDYTDWKVILRNESAQQLVLYNEADRSLQVQESGEMVPCLSEKKFCTECGRPWLKFDEVNNGSSQLSEKSEQNSSSNSSNLSPFMDRNYFRLLDISSRKLPALQIPDSSSVKSNNSNKRTDRKSSYTPATEDFIDQLHPKNLSDSSINQGYYQRFFVEGSKLGRGSGGSVFKCQHVLDGIELGAYAVKKVPVGDDHSWLNRMLREVHILENLRHQNIIEYKHAWLEYHKLTQFGPSIPCLFILMQLAEAGNLEEFVLNSANTTSEEFDEIPLYCAWFEQICNGLAHLHRCGILHRDLKPSNILLKVDQDQKIQLLITDFGECTSSEASATLNPKFSSPADHNRTGATGTIEFVAPELLKIDRKSGQYLYQQSKSTDIWSLGLIFYFMLTKRLPYADIDDIDVLKSAMTALNHVNLPKEANKLPRGFKKALEAMLQIDPELRPSIEQVLLLIRDNNASVPNNPSVGSVRLNVKRDNFKAKRRLSLPQPPAPSQSSSQLDENTRISLALLMIFISVIPTYPTIPSARRVFVAFSFILAAMKTSKPRTAIILLVTYSILVAAFYFNKID